MTVTRHTLRFDTLADAVRDAENLMANGYDTVGKWSLGQVCGHLSNWLSYPLDGFPSVPLPLRPVMWMVKVTSGQRMLRAILANGFKPGTPTMPESVPPATIEDADGVTKLKAAAVRFAAHTGPVKPSPLFGAMTKETADQIQRLHAAHHLRFLVPKG